MSAGGYCYCNGMAADTAKFGQFYNWYAVTNVDSLAPTGFHIPSNAEWTTLINYLGANAGGKLKETGTLDWAISNTGATNSSGFTALPGGYRDNTGAYSGHY